MLTIPIIGTDVPTKLNAANTPPHIAALVRTIAHANLFEASDLRTGSAAPARMIERMFERWAIEDNLPTRQIELPIKFAIDAIPKITGHNRAMLILTNSAVASRWYIGHPVKHWLGTPDQALLEHATAMLYDGLDALCYAPKPPEYLAWARTMWWDGGEGERTTPAVKRSRDPMNGRNRLPLRRAFDTAYPRWMQAPQKLTVQQLRAQKKAGKPHPALQKVVRGALVALNRDRMSRSLLKPNAHKLSEGIPPLLKNEYAPSLFACYIRHHQGDFSGRLMDDYLHRIHKNGYKTTNIHGAWHLDTREDLLRARRGIAANTRLAQSLIDLMNLIGDCATSSFMGVNH